MYWIIEILDNERECLIIGIRIGTEIRRNGLTKGIIKDERIRTGILINFRKR